MATRFVSVDSVIQRLPAGVINATKGSTAADFAPGLHTHADKWTMWSGTQSAYDALPLKDAGTLYAIVGP
jgi:hypothetical protein